MKGTPMSAQNSSNEHSQTRIANLELRIGGQNVSLQVPLRLGPMRRIELLNVFQDLADKVVDIGVKAVEAKGERISCKKGCGACCRQLVPISPTEARWIRELVNELPEPRRSMIRARFAEAREMLQASGLLEKLIHPEAIPSRELRPIGLEYFKEQIACPFLEEESCSIHPDRPIACREYLVTSPAAECAQPSAETVRCVPLPGKVSEAVSRLEQDVSTKAIPWVPLILAPEWAEAHASEPPPRTGPDLLKEFLGHLSGKEVGHP